MLFEFDHMCYGQVSCKMLCDQVVQFGGQTLEDDNRCGRPVTIFTVNNVVKAKSLIKEDPRMTRVEIQDALGISSGSVNQIINDHLDV